MGPRRRSGTRIGAAIVALAVAFTAGLASASVAAAFTGEQTAAFQQAMQDEAARGNYPGFMIGVWAPGQGQFVAATGVSNLETMAPLETSQPTRIGSNTKTFTATLVMQLVQSGAIRLNDTVSDFVRGIPRGRAITIRELLDHTSGIADLSPNVNAAITLRPHHHYTPTQDFRWGVVQPRVCRPGKCWSYSNAGFMLLGRIVERVTGRSLPHLYRQRIFEPLGLEDTSFHPGQRVPAGIVSGYQEVTPGQGFEDATHWNFSWIWSAGAMVSTMDDLRVYVRALADGHDLLDARTQRLRLQFVKTTIPHVGYGLGIAKVGGCLGHNGEVPGYDSIMLHCPSDGTTIIAFGNTAEELDNFGTGHLPDPDLFGIFRELKQIVDAG